MTLSNKAYDTLKWIAQILLPGLGTLYFAISGIWGLPYCEQVVGTLSAITVFIGMLLGLSAAKYPGDGTIKMQGATYKTKLSIPMDKLTEKKNVILKVEDGDKK
jgi:hypothetical protein